MRRLFASTELKPFGSLRFPLGRSEGAFGPVEIEGFALRGADGNARAFVNTCPHRGQPVDLGDGRLFSPSGLLECQAHGALFHPESGLCVGGPCVGRGLRPIAVVERDGELFLEEESEARPARI